MTFAPFNAHTNPIFQRLKIIKFPDLVFLHTALFMYDYHTGNLPISFKSYFTNVNEKHNYNTRLASKCNYYLPKVRTNYGKFNIKFSGVKIWTSISDSTKKLNKVKFKERVIDDILVTYTHFP